MRLRLMTYNILDGAIGREDSIRKVLEMSGADIVVLQEVLDLRLVQELAKKLRMDFVFAEGNSKRHLALLSRFPILSHKSSTPFPLRTSLLETVIRYACGREICVFGVHLQAHYWIACELWRLLEVKTILRRTRKTSQRPSLIVGDFNAVAPGDIVRRKALPLRLQVILMLQAGHIFNRTITEVLESGYFDCYRLVHPNDEGFTLPTINPHVRLDYIFADVLMKDFLFDCGVFYNGPIAREASDHYPLIADFEL